MSFTTGKDQDQLRAIWDHTSADKATYRSLPGNQEESVTLNRNARYPSKDGASKDQLPARGVWQVSDKTFLDQHVMLNEDITADDCYSFLLDAIIDISEGFKNYREFEQEKKIIGYHFDEAREGLFRVELFQLKEALGVNCTRLDGDGFSVSNLWDRLKTSLAESDFIVEEMDIMNETDDEYFLSDDEEDLDFDMDSFKYLDFARDPTFVNRLVQDIDDFNVGTHSLMLLAFNLLSDKNMDFISANYAQTIFDAIVERLRKPWVTVPVARCAARVIHKLMKGKNVAVTVEQMQTILDTIQNWSVEDAPKRSVIPTASEEASVLLSQTFGLLLQQMAGSFDDLGTQVTDIVDNSDFESVKDALKGFRVATN